MAERSYEFDLSPNEAAEFKSDLKEFAKNGKYVFVDGGEETKNYRNNINQHSAETSGKNPNLASVGVEIVDVTVEPRDPEIGFLMFAKTSAYDSKKISLTVAYDKSSRVSKKMAENFEQSGFIQKWNAR